MLDQGRVLLQHRPLEILKLGTGVEAELVSQHPADPAQGAERIALPPALILRQRQQRPPAFPQRLLLDHGVGPGEYSVPMAGAQGRLDVQLLRFQPQLAEAPRLDPAGIPAVQITQRLTTPQRQRVSQHESGPVRLLRRVQERPSTLDGALETLRVDLLERDR